jgi:hypothetical protein
MIMRSRTGSPAFMHYTAVGGFNRNFIEPCYIYPQVCLRAKLVACL